MFFSKGFLGTQAPLYMDIATVYFAILPFLLAFSIFYAVKKQYKRHFLSQAIILCLTLYIVILFEIGLRISGGFMEYSKYSNVSFDFMLIFLVIHIFIAIAAIAGWIFLFISSYKQYRKDELNGIKHKKIGKSIFAALTLTSIMGIFMYLFLFVF